MGDATSLWAFPGADEAPLDSSCTSRCATRSASCASETFHFNTSPAIHILVCEKVGGLHSVVLDNLQPPILAPAIHILVCAKKTSGVSTLLGSREVQPPILDLAIHILVCFPWSAPNHCTFLFRGQLIFVTHFFQKKKSGWWGRVRISTFP